MTFKTTLGHINTFDEFKIKFELTLTDIIWNWFEAIMKNIQVMASLRKKMPSEVKVLGTDPGTTLYIVIL